MWPGVFAAERTKKIFTRLHFALFLPFILRSFLFTLSLLPSVSGRIFFFARWNMFDCLIVWLFVRSFALLWFVGCSESVGRQTSQQSSIVRSQKNGGKCWSEKRAMAKSPFNSYKKGRQEHKRYFPAFREASGVCCVDLPTQRHFGVPDWRAHYCLWRNAAPASIFVFG